VKLRLAVLLMVSAPLGAVAVDMEESFSLTVMSFNVRYGTADDGPNSWEYRKQIFLETIQEADPDLLGTQECLLFQAEFIATELPQYKWFGVGREADGSGEYMAVFYREAVLEPLEAGNYWLSETPEVPGSMSWDTACTRMVTFAKFRHLPTGEVFWFLNTHLDHRSEQARDAGAALIAERVAALDPEVPVILAGDFNCAAGTSQPWTTLTQAGLRDAWTEAGEREGPETTWCGFQPPNPARVRRIDWILVGGPVQVAKAAVLAEARDGRYPSDHFPVVAHLRVRVAQ
jgi:endonuclease/exonuclease/phosphatase family metal-dependent hydrolase